MPLTKRNAWKLTSEFFWYRRFSNGQTEYEFDLDTGQPHKWGALTPPDIIEAGWLPMTPGLATLIRRFEEFGRPVHAPSISVIVKPGEELTLFKDGTLYTGTKNRCKACGFEFISKEYPRFCPKCGVRPVHKCENCGHIMDDGRCPTCGSDCREINPFEILAQVKWEETIYLLGIKGRYLHRFNATRMVTE